MGQCISSIRLLCGDAWLSFHPSAHDLSRDVKPSLVTCFFPHLPPQMSSSPFRCRSSSHFPAIGTSRLTRCLSRQPRIISGTPSPSNQELLPTCHVAWSFLVQPVVVRASKMGERPNGGFSQFARFGVSDYSEDYGFGRCKKLGLPVAAALNSCFAELTCSYSGTLS